MADEQVTVRMELRDQLSRPMRDVRRETQQTTTALQRLMRADSGTPLGRIVGGVSLLGRNLQHLDGPLRRASEGLGHMTGRATRWATIGLTAAAAATTRFGLQTAATFEQTRIAFDGFLGSAEQGAAMFDYLKDLNLKTPFELGDVTGAARQLLGFGFAAGEVKDVMSSVVNAASGLGAGGEGLNRIILNLGQVRAAGVVTGRELRDFATMGFPGYEIVADILGKTREEIRAMGDDAQVSADQFIAAVISQQGPLQRFAGMAEQQMNSLSGMWSNLKDAVQVRLADAASPLVSGLKEAMPRLTELIGSAMDTLAPPLMRLGVSLVDGLVRMLPVIEPVLASIANGAATLLEAMAPAFAALEPVGMALGDSIGRLVTALVPVMPSLVEGFVGLVGVLPAFVDLLTAMVPLVSPIVDLLGTLLGFEPVQGILGGVLAALLGYRALSSVIGTVWKMVAALRGLAIAQAAAGGAGAVAGGAGWLGKMTGGAAGAAGGAAAGLLAPAAAVVGGAGAGLMAANYAKDNPDSMLGRLADMTDIGNIGNGAMGRAVHGALGREVPSRYAVAESRTLSAAEIRQVTTNNSVTLNVQPMSQIDFERGVARVLRQDERDRRERR